MSIAVVHDRVYERVPASSSKHKTFRRARPTPASPRRSTHGTEIIANDRIYHQLRGTKMRIEVSKRCEGGHVGTLTMYAG